MRAKLEEQGIDVTPGNPEQFVAHVRKETERWTKVVKVAGLGPESWAIPLLSPNVATRKEVRGINRLVALLIGGVWILAGAGAIGFGLVHGRWGLAAAGVIAMGYGVLWLRVVVRSRLLTWSEVVAPWRAH